MRKASPSPAWWRRFTQADQRPVERRRARALLAAAAVFAAVVLMSALPWSTLLHQHAQLSSASAEVSALTAQNRALAQQASQLSASATQAALARQDYGLVKPGQKAYDILPPAGSTPSAIVRAGHVPLNEPPVVPGSPRSEQLQGAGAGLSPLTATAGASAGHLHAATRPATGATAAAAGTRSGGFWSRVGHTLEFWS